LLGAGGTAKLPMAELRALATELGATELQTYIASGNLIATPPGDAHAVAGLLRALNVVGTARDLRTVDELLRLLR